ncbi:MAG: FAD-binding oxidoreductase [Dehalococcoidia bacterium]|nr:FAD-binding oxidoreductase [Dehalococcoidia bacterium]
MSQQANVSSSPFAGSGEQRSETALFAVDGVAPRRVVFPRDVDALAETMRQAHAERLAVSPRGGGTKLSLGNPPRRLDLVVGTQNLTGVLDHQPANLTVTAQAGTPLAALQAALAEHGQFLPLESPLPTRATVGGVLAANASGPHRLAYGTARDWLIGVRVVHADGTVTKAGGKVVKNVTGYDLNKLYVGSLGTLGVIVEATFKVAPLPTVRRTVVARFASVEAACQAALAVDRAGIGPLAAVALNAEAARRVQVASPQRTGAEALLAVELGGRPMGVARREADLLRVLAEHGAARHEVLNNASDRFWQAAVDLGWGEAEPPARAVRCGVPPSAITSIVGTIRTLPLHLALAVQPAVGVLRAVAWADARSRTPDETLVDAVAVFRRVAALHGGYAVVERCDPALKARLDVWGDVGPSLALMRRVKEQFDPSGVLNPGRYVGGI